MKKVYFNASVITMEDNKIEQAVLFDNDSILAVGSNDEVLKIAHDAEKVDMQGKTILPAFIDAHSHFSALANSLLQVSLDECTSIEELERKISKFITDNNIKNGDWVIAKDFDQNNIESGVFPKRTDLDKISTDIAIAVQHKSGHCGSFNSLALKELGIDSSSVSPEGGLIEMENGEPTGYIEESAYMQAIQKVPMPDFKVLVESFKKAQDIYASFGICTVQEGMMVPMMKQLYDYLLQNDLFKLNVIAFVGMNEPSDLFEQFKQYIKKYDKNFKIGGFKIFLDGSPQARTAWMLTPYEHDKNYYGYGVLDDDKVFSFIKTALKNDVQILAHCNGDAAIQQYINAVKKLRENGFDVSKIRPVIIHSQLIQESQLDEVKKLNMIPSFFIAHVYYWGDAHIKNFGLLRASQISPAKSAIDRDIIFTFHQDSPVIEPNMLETVWCAVTRTTESGAMLGNDQCISVYDALKAVTINAAYQYFEEDIKGSIKKGKKADLVILDKNPLEVETDEIKNIKVLQTIKDGFTIYKH